MLLFFVVVLAVLGVGLSKSPVERAQNVLAQMTLSEKLSMMHGRMGLYIGNIPGNVRLGIPELRMQDGPQGFRATKTTGNAGSTTAWPSALTIASSWDTDVAYRWASSMGKEFRRKGANMQLAPGIGLARVPNAGRNFEYLCGEDPVLGSILVPHVINGIQHQGVIANAKHWINNEIETSRRKVSSDVSERTRFEIYYPPFQAAVDAGVLSIMCSYNRINDISSCENPETMSHLRNQLNFKGWILSDWLATYSTLPSLNAGLDQEMPLGLFYNERVLENQIQSGNLTESRVDESILRILTSIYSADLISRNSEPFGKPSNNVTSDEHNLLAREFAAKSTVLLKNTNDILPLNVNQFQDTCIAVFGDTSTISGGGSGHVTPYYIITPEEGIRNTLKSSGISADVFYNSGEDLDAAADLAKKCGFAVVVVATTSTEASDRPSLSLDGNQDDLVKAIGAANPNTIVSVNTPGAVLLPWADQIPAILISWMPGQEFGNALADVLFGSINPSARLPVTLPNVENEVGFTKAQFPGIGHPPDAYYSEELLVGYRWYTAKGVKPHFPFGHGLSYTTFEYRQLNVNRLNQGISSQLAAEAFVTVSFVVENTGKRPGNDIPQLYVTYPTSANEPPIQLRNFKKTSELSPGTSQRVVFSLSPRDLSIWDETIHSWTLPKGTFVLHVGSSSQDLRLSQEINL